MLALILGSVSAAARDNALRMTHYTINDGLSQSSANALLEDRRGFLWIGTQDGLNRFDGYEFVVYRHDAENPASLASNNVSALYESRDGTLWIGTTGGTLHAYDRDLDRFLRYPLPSYSRESGNTSFVDDIRQVLESSDGRFWVGSRSHGLWELDRGTGTFRAIPNVRDQKINSLAEGPDGVLWIGTSTGGLLWYWPESGRTVASDSLDPDVYSILPVSNGEFWTGGDRGIVFRYSGDRRLLGQFPATSESSRIPFQVRAMLEDRNGHVWIGTIGGGLLQFNRAGGREAAFRNQTSDPNSLSTDTVFSLELDSAGVLWAGSLAAGLSKVSIAGAQFTNYWHQPENPASLSDNVVNEFVEDPSGNLWIGTNGGGVNYMDRERETFRHFRHDPDNPSSLSNDRVWGMHLDDDGILWVGTWGDGLNRLDTRTGSVLRIPSDDAHGLPGRIVTTIVGDGAGGIWVGMADGGMAHRAAAGERFESRHLFDQQVEQTRPANISAAFLDSRQRLWVGTWSQGLCVLASGHASFTCHTYDADDTATINDNNIRAINEDVDGGIWIATAKGIAKFDETGPAFARLTSRDGLPEGTIYGIIPTDGALWLSSNQGLYRFDTRSREVRGYSFHDGLLANEFNGAAYLKASDGTLFFGGVGGITSFRPENLTNNDVPPKVAITGLRLFNEPLAVGDDSSLLDKSITETRAIELYHAQNVITIEYVGLHFASPELNRYAHRLAGFERDWVYRDASRRSATYTNLDPGDYEFRVRAANSDGTWSEDDAVLAITILPPWWMTWWARGSLVLAVALLIFLTLRWRLNLVREQTRQLESEVESRTAQVVSQRDTIRQQARDLEEVLEAKNRFFARLSHEFRTPITLMLGPIEEQLEHAPDGSDRRALSMARRNGRRLLHLVNQLLGLARTSGERTVSLVPTNLTQVARVTADSFMPLVVRKELGFEVTADDEVWVRGNSEGLQIVISNLLSNAVKYTDKHGSVSLSVATDGSTARIEVSDTGVGIPEKHLPQIFGLFERGAAVGEGSGIGLTLVKEVVEAYGGTIAVDSRVGQGTTVSVELPALATNEERGSTGEFLGLEDADLFVDSDDVSDDSPEPIADDSHKPCILVVEDNRDMRKYLRSLLEPDYDVIEAADGLAGVDKAVGELPDLVITDIMMPSADGFELLRELRGNLHTSHVPVVMLTALDDQESRLTGLREKADDYLTKPFDRRELLLRVRNLLELSRIRARRMGQLLYVSEGAPIDDIARTDGLGQRDREFLKRLETSVEKNYQDAGFRIEQMADSLFMSPRQLQRKMKALLDTAPAAYLRDYRLKRARTLLLDGRNVSEVAFATGFSSVSYFGRCFKGQFGVAPSEAGLGSHKRDIANVAN